VNPSMEKLEDEAGTTGFRVDMLEKVVRLLRVLEGMRDHPFLKGKLALKGGTALNLFVFDVPRLSVDIDLNYVGSAGRIEMMAERPEIERALQAVFGRQDLLVRRIPTEHAGGKWLLRYIGAGRRGGVLEVEINYMYRVPLWPVKTVDSRRLGSWQAKRIPVLDLHELMAGKLCALLSRRRARDLFDVERLLSMDGLENERLRIAFVAYGAMARRDWREVSVTDAGFERSELNTQLLPALRRGVVTGSDEGEAYGRTLVSACRRGLSTVLPFTDSERAFLDRVLDKGELVPALLTPDEELQDRIRNQPLLRWKALNVRRHRGLSSRLQDVD